MKNEEGEGRGRGRGRGRDMVTTEVRERELSSDLAEERLRGDLLLGTLR